MKKPWIVITVVTVALAAAASVWVYADHRGQPHNMEPPRSIQLQGKSVIDLGAAIDIALGRVPGDVLKVELENEDNRLIYEVKVLAADGRVRKVKLDAQDGSLIEVEDD